MTAKAEVQLRPTPRVLLIEDNALISMDLEEILKNFGCHVLGPRVRVQDALDAIESEDIDVAVVDYMLEDGDAEPIARKLNDKGIPFAFCTGTPQAHVGSLYPHTPILGKPFNPEDVSTVVNSLMASRLANA
ncbi:hypothetical protein [Hyphomicrobium sp.]|uniref:hypothetical protein n=1 Tax=Hyphomicrobium sp. TaxID=82 RepID=UPI00356B4E99